MNVFYVLIEIFHKKEVHFMNLQCASPLSLINGFCSKCRFFVFKTNRSTPILSFPIVTYSTHSALVLYESFTDCLSLMPSWKTHAQRWCRYIKSYSLRPGSITDWSSRLDPNSSLDPVSIPNSKSKSKSWSISFPNFFCLVNRKRGLKWNEFSFFNFWYLSSYSHN